MKAVRKSQGTPRGEVHDLGVVGWYRVLELTGNLPDVCRVGRTVQVGSLTYRIAGISSVEPKHGGVTVRAEIAERRVDTGKRNAAPSEGRDR